MFGIYWFCLTLLPPFVEELGVTVPKVINSWYLVEFDSSTAFTFSGKNLQITLNWASVFIKR